MGWVATERSCRAGHSYRWRSKLYETEDGGLHWHAERMPIQRVWAIAFTSHGVGYTTDGTRTFVTTDSARSWSLTSAGPVESLAVGGRYAYRITYRRTGCPGPCSTTIQRAEAGSGDWRTVTDQGSEFGSSITADGNLVVALIYGHVAGGAPEGHTQYLISTDAGATWQMRTDPCGGFGRTEKDTGTVAVRGHSIASICNLRYANSRPVPTSFLKTSIDDGHSFTRQRGTRLAFDATFTSDRTIIASNVNRVGRPIYHLASHAGGEPGWHTDATLHVRPIDPLLNTQAQFSCAARACAFVADRRGLLITQDDGRTWSRRRV